jgi:hypothetical protein
MIAHNFYFLYIAYICRLKAETQLISWLNKYDNDVGEKQAEYDKVLAGFEEEKQQMQQLMVKDFQTDKLFTYLS